LAAVVDRTSSARGKSRPGQWRKTGGGLKQASKGKINHAKSRRDSSQNGDEKKRKLEVNLVRRVGEPLSAKRRSQASSTKKSEKDAFKERSRGARKEQAGPFGSFRRDGKKKQGNSICKSALRAKSSFSTRLAGSEKVGSSLDG